MEGFSRLSLSALLSIALALPAFAGAAADVDDFNEGISEGIIPALTPALAGAGFLKAYTAEGRPTFNYTLTFRKRFGERLNRGTPLSSLPAPERKKWLAIYAELRRAGDRTQPLDSSLLFMPTAQAKIDSELYETLGTVQRGGGWSIAVKGTAPRHGFSNVPCAEFQSELIREAYARAGYDHREDFSEATGNPLIWNETAAVVHLATALDKAGWTPWEAAQFKPLPGAVMMHSTATTPGHAYMAAGEDGRFIVDNGAPGGRDLRATSDHVISLMYRTGVFFLPPGIFPDRW